MVILASTDLNDPESVILREKTMSNVKEVKARDGIVIATLRNSGFCDFLRLLAAKVIPVLSSPKAIEWLMTDA